jgi:hypothetical protein
MIGSFHNKHYKDRLHICALYEFALYAVNHGVAVLHMYLSTSPCQLHLVISYQIQNKLVRRHSRAIMYIVAVSNDDFLSLVGLVHPYSFIVSICNNKEPKDIHYGHNNLHINFTSFHLQGFLLAGFCLGVGFSAVGGFKTGNVKN